MSTHKLIASKRKSLLSFCHPVVIATSLSVVMLTGCQTTTGMQDNPQSNGEPARSSTIINEHKSASTIGQTPNPPQERPGLSNSPSNIPSNQDKPVYSLNQPPHHEPVSQDRTNLPNVKESPVYDADNVANPGSSKRSNANDGAKVEEAYGVIFPTEEAARTRELKRERGQETSIGQVINNASPMPTTSTTDNTAPVESANNVDANVSGAAQPIPPTAVVIRLPKPDQESVQQTLLNQARQHSTAQPNKTLAIATGDDIPAFKRLMNSGVQQLRQGQLSAAQSTFTRAQRLAPQSSAVYFYLGQVALKQNQYLKAEAMARRGLVVAQTASSKKALWQVILKSAQYQGNQRVIEEAQAALSH